MSPHYVPPDRFDPEEPPPDLIRFLFLATCLARRDLYISTRDNDEDATSKVKEIFPQIMSGRIFFVCVRACPSVVASKPARAFLRIGTIMIPEQEIEFNTEDPQLIELLKELGRKIL